MKKENKKILIATFLTFTLTSLLFISIILNIKIEDKKIFEEKNIVNNKSFAIMLQGENGYVASEESTWPTSGYILNEELTNCVDNSGTKIENVLNYDSGQVSLKSNKNIFCYLYFDKGGPLGQFIIDNSISGLDKNIIGTDPLYRFSGTSGNTGINNYICLGTTSKCDDGSDNMYRIIGVEPDTGYVKVIKQTKYGSNIAWNSSLYVTWPQSSAYNTMTTWYNSVSFKSMIVSHSWGITDVSTAPTTRASAFSAETSSSTTEAYVGMLALSDYYLAYRGDQNWNSSYSNYTNNWTHLANNGNTSDAEWTMSRATSSSVWFVNIDGYVGGSSMTGAAAVRPVFYLDSTVMYEDGDGTSGDPFIVG